MTRTRTNVALRFWLVAPLLLVAARADGQEERISTSPEAMTLAPGRRGWIHVSQLMLTSPRSAKPISANVTVTSSDSSIAELRPDSNNYWAVDARRTGSTRITFRSRGDTVRVAQANVTVRQAPVGNEAGLTYSATARLTPSQGPNAASAPLGPMELAVTVTIRNTATEPRDIWLSSCAAWIRVYRTRDKSGPPIKDIPRGVQCGGGEQHVTFAPGESRKFSASGFRLIERDTLANARHFVVAVVDRVRDLKDVDAGPVDFVSPSSGLRLRASIARDSAEGTMIRARVTITNTNRQSVRLEYGACSVSWLAYRDSGATGKAAWNADHYNLPPGVEAVCPMYLATGRVQPGRTASPKEFNAAFDAAKILGDSLPPGRYYFIARVELNWRASVLQAGSIMLTRD